MSDTPLLPGGSPAGVVRQAQSSAGGAGSPLAALGKKNMNKEEAEKAAKDFESFFLSQMLQPIFDTVDVDDTFGGGQGEEMWKSLLVDEYAKQISKKGGIGVAEQVMKVLLKDQEGGAAAPAAGGAAVASGVSATGGASGANPVVASPGNAVNGDESGGASVPSASRTAAAGTAVYGGALAAIRAAGLPAAVSASTDAAQMQLMSSQESEG